jgi:WD40 repeat protein
MRNRWWLLTIVLVVFACQLVQAQEQPERAVITPENAADLQAVKLIGQDSLMSESAAIDYWNLPQSLAFSPDSMQLLIGGTDAQIWDVTSKQLIATYTAPVLRQLVDVAFSPDGTLIAGSGDDHCQPGGECTLGTAHIWEIATGRSVRITGRAAQYANEIRNVIFSEDGQWLATSNPLSLWQASTLFDQSEYSQEEATRLWLPEDPKGLADTTLQRDRFSIDISPNNQWLLSAGFDGILRLYDVTSGAEVLQIDTGHQALIIAAFSPDGQMIAGAVNEWLYQVLYGDGEINEDPATWTNTLRLWDVGTGEEVAILGQTEARMGMTAFSPDGRLIAVGLDDGTVRLWDIESRQQVATLQKSNARIMDIAFSPDGTWLAVAQSDGATWLWAVTGS